MKKWIQLAIKNKGALRRTAGVRKGKTISISKLKSLTRRKGITGKRARLALTLRKLRRK
jgi:hypothetical protein